MPRFSRYDTDEERLPEGMERVGYDADTQVYTYRDADGSYWEGAPGAQYGRLTKVSDGDDDAPESAAFLGSGYHSDHDGTSWRTELRPLLNFGVLIGLSLLLFFWYMNWASGSKDAPAGPKCVDGFLSYQVHSGDTCWDIANDHNITVDDLFKDNEGLQCNSLDVGTDICLPDPSASNGDDVNDESKA